MSSGRSLGFPLPTIETVARGEKQQHECDASGDKAQSSTDNVVTRAQRLGSPEAVRVVVSIQGNRFEPSRSPFGVLKRRTQRPAEVWRSSRSFPRSSKDILSLQRQLEAIRDSCHVEAATKPPECRHGLRSSEVLFQSPVVIDRQQPMSRR